MNSRKPPAQGQEQGDHLAAVGDQALGRRGLARRLTCFPSAGAFPFQLPSTVLASDDVQGCLPTWALPSMLCLPTWALPSMLDVPCGLSAALV